jgi:hypothetical protein
MFLEIVLVAHLITANNVGNDAKAVLVEHG